MPTQTDAAKELAHLCDRLRGLRQNKSGSEVLAAEFAVPAWSVDFYELIFTIVKRLETLKVLIRDLGDVDQDIREQAISHLDVIANAFTQVGLNNPWSHASNHFISPEYVNPLRMLSSEVRRVQPLPKLSDEEQAEMVTSVDELLGWLRGIQAGDRDFIRQAMIDGLEQFRFRVERVSWVGWGYTLDSLKAVIGAHLALERGLDPNDQPQSKAVLMKVSGVLKTIFEKVGVVKDAQEKGEWLIEGYKNISALAVGLKVAGLITFSG